MAKRDNLLCIEISLSLMDNRKQISNYFSSPNTNNAACHQDYTFKYSYAMGFYFDDACKRVGGGWKQECNPWIGLEIILLKKDILLCWNFDKIS